MKTPNLNKVGITKDAPKFAEEFLQEYLKDGFGSASKKDVELCVFRLLERHGNLAHKDNNTLSHEFQLTEAKVRNLRYEGKLRFPPKDKNYLEQEILCYLTKASFINTGTGQIQFTVEDVYVQKSLNAKVKQLGGVPDTSFNREIVTLKKDHLVALAESLYSVQSAKDLETKLEQFEGKDDELKKTQTDFKNILLIFLKSTAKSLGSSAVKGLEAYIKSQIYI
jgi:hypothetical protein